MKQIGNKKARLLATYIWTYTEYDCYNAYNLYTENGYVYDYHKDCDQMAIRPLINI